MSFDQYASALPLTMVTTVQSYRDGRTDLPTTKAALIGFRYADTDYGPGFGERGRWHAVEDRASFPAEPDSIRQRDQIADHGGITQAEVGEVEHEWERQDDKGDYPDWE